MQDCGVIIERICRLPLDFRDVGAKSAIQMATEIGILENRACITLCAIESYLRVQPELIEEWLIWSGDKRYAPSWYFSEDGDEFIVGFYPNGEIKRYNDRVVACAEFVIHEIDELISQMAS